MRWSAEWENACEYVRRILSIQWTVRMGYFPGLTCIYTDRFQTKLGIATASTKIIVTCKRCNRSNH